MKRRPWYQLTDKIQDAQFVWTQIKNPTIFQSQKKGDPLNPSEKNINTEGKQAKGKVALKHFNLFNEEENEKWQSYWLKNM